MPSLNRNKNSGIHGISSTIIGGFFFAHLPSFFWSNFYIYILKLVCLLDKKKKKNIALG